MAATAANCAAVIQLFFYADLGSGSRESGEYSTMKKEEIIAFL